MSGPPRVPGLSDKWAEHQLTLDVPARGCDSCTYLTTRDGARGWECDPERPGCPLEDIVCPFSADMRCPADPPCADPHTRACTGDED